VTFAGMSAVLMMSALLASSTAARADTLLGALSTAYQHNPQLNSQRAVVRQTDEQVPQALSGYKPTIAATAMADDQYYSSVTKGVGATGAPVYTHNPVVVANPSVGITATQTSMTGSRPRTGFARPRRIPRQRVKPCAWPSRRFCR
jgi:outer membrane protein